MKRIKSVDIMNNKQTSLNLSLASLPVIVVFFSIFTYVTFVFAKLKGSLNISFTWSYLIWLVVALIVTTVIHEGIHGLFFKLFNSNGKVNFGFKNGMAYATSPGSQFSKGQFACISLAPFILITVAFTLIYYFTGISSFFYILLASLHAGGCIGDFYWVYLVIRAPKHALIEDTENGIDIYMKEDTATPDTTQ